MSQSKLDQFYLKMLKKIYLFLIIFIVLGSQMALGQEENTIEQQAFNSSAGALLNPFVPMLPVKEEPVVIEVEPEIEETEKTPQIIVKPEVEVEKEPPILGVPNLTITGLIWNSDRPQAIVNGNIIEVGDRVFGVPTDQGETIPELTFVGIDKNGLLVSFLDKTVTISPTDVTKEQKK